MKNMATKLIKDVIKDPEAQADLLMVVKAAQQAGDNRFQPVALLGRVIEMLVITLVVEETEYAVNLMLGILSSIGKKLFENDPQKIKTFVEEVDKIYKVMKKEE